MRIPLLFICLCSAMVMGCNETQINSETSNATMKVEPKSDLINGEWEVSYIADLIEPIEEVFPKRKPTILFNRSENTVSGYAGCNNFNGTAKISDQQLNIGEALAMTRMMCPDMTGEDLFVKSLAKVDSYSISDDGKTLSLITGEITAMRFSRK